MKITKITAAMILLIAIGGIALTQVPQSRSLGQSPSPSGVVFTGNSSWIVDDDSARRELEKLKNEKIWDTRPLLAAPSVDAPPSTLHIGPYTYTLHYTSGKALLAHDALAQTFLEEREIWLNPERRKNLRVDLLHEVLHCAKSLSTDAGRFHGEYDPEENVVSAIAWSLEEILQDNPALVEWLTGSSYTETKKECSNK